MIKASIVEINEHAEIGYHIQEDWKWILSHMPVTLIRAQAFSKKWSKQKLHELIVLMYRNQLKKGWSQNIKMHKMTGG